MEVQIKQINDVIVLTLSGSNDAFSAPRIIELINNKIADGKTKLVADFKAVDTLAVPVYGCCSELSHRNTCAQRQLNVSSQYTQMY